MSNKNTPNIINTLIEDSKKLNQDLIIKNDLVESLLPIDFDKAKNYNVKNQFSNNDQNIFNNLNNSNPINKLNNLMGIGSPNNFTNNILNQIQQSTNSNQNQNYISPNFEQNSNMESNNLFNQSSSKFSREMSNEANELVLNYTSNHILYSIAFQNSIDCPIALGTMEKSLNNKIEIIENNDEKLTLTHIENHEFPSTKLMWGYNTNNSDLLASSSDVVRLYKYNQDKKLENTATLSNKRSKYCSPLTSFDWNKENNSILSTASIDNTCTIWDINKLTIRTQLIAHDKEVYDIAFSQDEYVFISTGADGSIRLFDLRCLDHSTIIYETKDQTPITKIAWNSQNNNFISALGWNKDLIYIIDSRVAMVSLVELKTHTEPVSGMSWAPQSTSHICSVGEDKLVLIWNLESQINNPNSGPLLSYKAPSPINNVSWCQSQTQWIGITLNKSLQLLRV